jgi:hypothetical protein
MPIPLSQNPTRNTIISAAPNSSVTTAPVWRSNPRVRDRLGWATSPEVAFDGMFQADSAESSVATLYLRTRDGAIIALDAFNEQWEVLPPVAGADTP